MITASVSARAISERTPRQPPTTVTATANSAEQEREHRDPVQVGDRDDIVASGSVETFTTTSSPTW